MTEVKHQWPWTVVVSEGGCIHNLEYANEAEAREIYQRVQTALADAHAFRNDRETFIQLSDALGSVTIHTIHIRSVRIVNGELHTREVDRLDVERTAARKAALAALTAE